MLLTSGLDQATVLLVDGVGYVDGDEAVLTSLLGFQQAMAGRMAGRWVSFRPGESGGGVSYQSLTSSMTIAGFAKAMQLTGRLSLTARTVDEGAAVIGVHGDAASAWGFPTGSTETVYVAAAGRPLPVSEQVANPKGGTATYTFTEWGEPLPLIAPPDPVPITSFSGVRQ